MAGSARADHIVERAGQWLVLSEDRSKVLGSYGSRAAAAKRLAQIEFFKHRTDTRKKLRQALPRQIPPKLIEAEYAKALMRILMPAARRAYAPAIEAVKEAVAARKAEAKTDAFDPDEPRDGHGQWTGSGVDPDRERAGRAEDEKEARFKAYEAKEAARHSAELANATRRTLGAEAPRGWSDPDTNEKLTPTEVTARLAELSKQAAEARAAGEHGLAQKLEGPDTRATLRAGYQKGKAYDASFANLDIISLPGHLYRGMSAEEYDTTVAKGLGVASDNRASFTGEGVSFGYDAGTASSYANSPNRSPAATGKPTYIVEARATPEITYSGFAGYPQTAIGKGLGQEHVTRVFKFTGSPYEELKFKEIPVPASKTDSAHMDASDRQKILRLIRQGAAKLKKTLSLSQIENLAQKFAQRTQTYQRIQLSRQVKAALGADPLIGDKRLSARMGKFVKDNVKLVKRIPERLHQDLEGIVQQGATEAWPSEFTAGLIEERFGIAERHARLIARDQTSKLYADVNHDRQQELGVTRFVWRTVHDERVRGDPEGKYPKALPSHFELDGQEFSYDDPPEVMDGEVGLPGDAIQCRCFAEPILDDVLDGEEEPEDGEDSEGDDGENPEDRDE